ncbi:hypothetical protein ERO13_A08G122650v2 [Gossypium hirsutum]|uniref:Calcineurin-like phosphoesterase domain-containing protein n=1 Tax=Gossypium darwinii TaxID=34276 RepID=A0A5D2FM28_GOSDA|nr:hypothetical protein ERO13_A08G122650v2 [Gossypium hirsutum]TYH06306.1 hypothetical protein ES288_A08G145900v1 [Gossypium darwinii]
MVLATITWRWVGLKPLVLQTNQSSTSTSLTLAITPRFLLSLAMAGLNPLSNYGFNAPLQNFIAYMKPPMAKKPFAPGLVYFHIPLPEFASFGASNFTGVRQEGISSASINSGFFNTTMVEAGEVKAVFIGHDHLNDFCGQMTGIQLCYADGFRYHAYGKARWSRRARVVLASLKKTDEGDWGAVKSIKAWKPLDDEHLTAIDGQVLWSKHLTPKL